VEKDYQILFLTKTDGIGWIEIDGERYTDEECGLLHYGKMHKIPVCGAALDKARKYTVVFVEYKEKPVYYPKGEEVCREEYDFTPVTGDDFTLFMFADTHGAVDVPLQAYRNFADKYGEADLLLLNGDINDSSASIHHFEVSFALISGTVGGSRPVIYARGNHDTRGAASELLPGYSPTAFRNGRRESYWSFRQGNLWGLVLDCGEDKCDTSIEYGGTIQFDTFRQRETAYIQNLLENAETEWAAQGIRHRIVFCHIPFNRYYKHPFDAGINYYDQWIRMLGEMKADLLLCGHLHAVELVSGPDDRYKTSPFPTLVSSSAVRENDGVKKYICAALFCKDGARTAATLCNGEIMETMSF